MNFVLHGTVGPSGQNHAEDVRLVRALLNVHRRTVNNPVLPMWATTDPELFAAIARFQVVQGASVASGTIAPQGGSWQGLLASLAASRTTLPVVPPARGRLTWDAEGQEGGRFHSRVLHVPTASSGLTLGRGYDFRERARVEVQQQLTHAGVAPSDAASLSGGARLVGRAAESFIVNSDLLDFEVSPGCQLRLFEAVYAEMENDVQRICAARDVVVAYGAVDWRQLDARIKDMLVDLRYRGDYTARSRRHIQPSVVQNDLSAFAKTMSDHAIWTAVPPDRFERRKQFLA
ncbi:MAG: hypothetical protein CL583_04880 [Alteromonadaceae bacterium]|nr:hypothetical protein [Alteromonadaceae bacterium]|tara:strand:+ start:487 stop:1353 length:867 start_codon:yes stop_codon:yes gene_type:complete